MNATDRSCKNCGSTEIYFKDVTARGGYGPDLLPIGGFWSSPKFQLRVCGSCGLTMWFVPQEYLAKVKEKFARYYPTA
jgi:hypothetical protein